MALRVLWNGFHWLKPRSHLFCLHHVATGSPCKHMLLHKNRRMSIPVLRCNTHPNHFICTSGRNVTQANICELALSCLIDLEYSNRRYAAAVFHLHLVMQAFACPSLYVLYFVCTKQSGPSERWQILVQIHKWHCKILSMLFRKSLNWLAFSIMLLQLAQLLGNLSAIDGSSISIWLSIQCECHTMAVVQLYPWATFLWGCGMVTVGKGTWDQGWVKHFSACA